MLFRSGGVWYDILQEEGGKPFIERPKQSKNAFGSRPFDLGFGFEMMISFQEEMATKCRVVDVDDALDRYVGGTLQMLSELL